MPRSPMPYLSYLTAIARKVYCARLQACRYRDTQVQVQALRHLYTLACNKRVMRAVDVNIRQPVYVPVSLAMVANDHTTTPSTGIDRGSENQPDNLQARPSSMHHSDQKSGFEVNPVSSYLFRLYFCSTMKAFLHCFLSCVFSH